MRIIGNISKINAEKRLYEVVSNSLEEYILFFEELEGMRFIMGDVLEFDSMSSPVYGLCVLNPERITNLYFEELKVHLQNQTTFLAYVYNKNNSGFDISYQGFRCFCPYYEIVINENINEEEILNSYQEFHVISIEEYSVVLSKKKIIQKELLELKEVKCMRALVTVVR